MPTRRRRLVCRGRIYRVELPSLRVPCIRLKLKSKLRGITVENNLRDASIRGRISNRASPRSLGVGLGWSEPERARLFAPRRRNAYYKLSHAAEFHPETMANVRKRIRRRFCPPIGFTLQRWLIARTSLTASLRDTNSEECLAKSCAYSLFSTSKYVRANVISYVCQYFKYKSRHNQTI